MSFQTFDPSRYVGTVNKYVDQSGGFIAAGKRSNWPAGARVIKPAQWIMYPNESGTGYQMGLGRYRRAYRRPRTVIREYAPRYISVRKPAKRTYRRKKTATKKKSKRTKVTATYKTVRSGRGGFWDTLKNIGGDVLGAVAKVAAPVGHALLAKGAQMAMNKITGEGRYSVMGGVPTFSGRGGYGMSGGVPVFSGTGAYGTHMGRPALMGPPQAAIGADDHMGQVIQQEIPNIINAGEGEIVIRHREYIADIVSTGPAFSLVANLQINPGLAPEDGGAFPWLSGIAKHFQQYRFEGLTFQFVSTSGTQGVTQALGEVIMSTNYNVNDPVPTNKQQMLTQAFAVSKVPAADFDHPIETAPSQTVGNGKLYVRGGKIETGTVSDPRFYDMCETNIATQGQNTNAGESVTLGELWVTYQCSLYKPQIPSVSRQNTTTQSGYVAQIGGSGGKGVAPDIHGLFKYNTVGDQFWEYDNLGATLIPGSQSVQQTGSELYFGPDVFGRFVLIVTMRVENKSGDID